MTAHVKNAPVKTHPLWLRLTHWINALAVIIMIMSGWRIYNASPLFDFRFANDMTLGGWLAGALQWHFAAMWLLVINGIFYLVMNFATGRFNYKFRPVSFKAFKDEVGQAMRFKLHHTDLRRYNMIQKLTYLGIIAVLIVIVLSGLVIYKPVQFPLLREVMGDYDTARYIHFVCMALICGFIAIHVVMSLLVPKTLKGMILGRAE